MSKQIFEIADQSISLHGRVKTIRFFRRKIKEIQHPKSFSEVTLKRSLKAGIMYVITKP